MKSTILLYFDSILQSFGFQSNSKERDSGDLPTKSMVIGMLLNALGHEKYNKSQQKDAEIWSSKLRFAVRDESENNIDYNYFYDFQTATNKQLKELKTKQFLLNRKFLILLEGEIEDLKVVYNAFMFPKRPLYFGKKECVLQKSLFNYIIDKDKVSIKQETPIFENKSIEDILFDEEIDFCKNRNDNGSNFLFDRNHMIELKEFECYPNGIEEKINRFQKEHSINDIYLRKYLKKNAILKQVYPALYENFLYYKVVVIFK